MKTYSSQYQKHYWQVVIVLAVFLGLLGISSRASAASPGLPDGVHTVTGPSGMVYAGWIEDKTNNTIQDALYSSVDSESKTAVIPTENRDHQFEMHAYAYNPTDHTIPIMDVLQSGVIGLQDFSLLTMSEASRIDTNSGIAQYMQYGIDSGDENDGEFYSYTGQGVGQSNYKIAVGVNVQRDLPTGQYMTLVMPFKVRSDAKQTSLYQTNEIVTPTTYQSTFTRYANGVYENHYGETPALLTAVTYDHGYPVIVKHVDENGNPIGTDESFPAADNDTQDGKTIDLTGETIAGYAQDSTNPTEYKYNVTDGEDAITRSASHVVTLKYKKSSTATTPGGGGGGGGSTTPTSPTTTPEQPHTIPTTTGKTGLGVTTTIGGQKVAAKGQAVYAIKGIYLYKNKTFTASARRAHYPKARRVNRPMFVVTGYTYSKNGALRYIVRDVNHTKRTDGWKGYITANSKYVVPVYYASLPKSRTITVIATKGINAYNKVNLTSKAKHYKKGAHLKVKKIVRHNLTTRYVLSNGDYITANKKLIIAGKY